MPLSVVRDPPDYNRVKDDTNDNDISAGVDKIQLAFGGPLISMSTEKKIFYKKKIKNNKKSEKSFQSGPNLKSFAFNRGGRVDLRAPKAIGGPKNRVGAQN